MKYSYQGQPIKVIETTAETKSENWLDDFTVVVENVGTKPVYSVDFALIIEEAATPSIPYMMHLTYGRPTLMPFETPTSDDHPLMPGERAELKLNPKAYRVFTEHLRESHLSPISHVELTFQYANLGAREAWVADQHNQQ